MSIKFIIDSCCDLSKELKEKLEPALIPLHIDVGHKHFIDNEEINTIDLLSSMKSYKGAVATACPSPEDYASVMRKYEESYIITLSSKLSGSNQSARIAKDIVLNENPGKFIHIFDSLSASAGQTRILLELYDSVSKGLSKEALVETVEKFIKNMKTNFVLESLDNLIKNGRISRLTGQVASVLSLRPIMGSNGHGEIALLEKARGTQKAMEKLLATVVRHFSSPEAEAGKVVISHCNCLERANTLRENILSACEKVTEVLVVPTGGISTVYANDGGLVVAY